MTCGRSSRLAGARARPADPRNGSNELLLQVFLVFGGHGRKTLLFHPTYSMHGRLTQLAGGTVVEEMVGLPYEVTKERALAAMAKARPEIVVFTTPNNPTGGEIDADVILAVAVRFPETLVLVDEAYSDFAGKSLVSRMDEFPNLVISKTFSKVLAAAGLAWACSSSIRISWGTSPRPRSRTT